jgi:hypothetical protein
MCDLEENPGVLIRASPRSCDTERSQDGRPRLILTGYWRDGSKAESRGPPEILTKTTAGASALYSRSVGDVGTVARNSNNRNAAKNAT